MLQEILQPFLQNIAEATLWTVQKLEENDQNVQNT